MKLRTQALLALSTLACTIPAFAQGRGPGGNNGHKPGVESTTNLSYPAVFNGTPQQSGTIGDYKLDAVFPTGVSYGCLIPETVGTTTYTNTSCVDTAGTPQDYDTCVARCGAVPVERIYWQKNPNNTWQAGYSSVGSNTLSVSFIDWGDNLESKSWPPQALRVETNTFSALPDFVLETEIADNPAVRFDVWHVSGQGTDELWGVHATDEDPSVPYVVLDNSGNIYWPYAVNVSSAARLNIAKLETGASACPATATGATQSPFTDASNLSWDSSKSAWTDAPYSRDFLYGAELNIKGSYIYGYNWDLRSEIVPPDVNKAGWWRLTFYTPNHSIDFNTWEPPTASVDTLAAPANPVNVGEISAAAETGLLLYVPQVDTTNQMTYLDICITSTGGGGSGGRGGRRGGTN